MRRKPQLNPRSRRTLAVFSPPSSGCTVPAPRESLSAGGSSRPPFPAETMEAYLLKSLRKIKSVAPKKLRDIRTLCDEHIGAPRHAGAPSCVR